MNRVKTKRTALRQVKRIATGIWRRIDRRSTVGLGWKRQGSFITFRWDGFVAAPSVPMLFARHHYETSVIRRLLGDTTIPRSLEIGCGFGRLTPTFAALSDQHTAVDINPDAIAAARIAYPELEFLLTMGTDLPFEDDTFDLVATWTVLQHVPKPAIEVLLAELLRVVKPTGRILLCEETREAGAPSEHSWHRPPEYYARHLAPWQPTYSQYIREIDVLPDLVSPGRVMLFLPGGR